jgi:hypothetical protein
VGLNLNRYFYVLDRAGKTFIERMFFAKEASRRASSGGDLFVINPEEGGIPLDAKGAIELHDRLQLLRGQRVRIHEEQLRGLLTSTKNEGLPVAGSPSFNSATG